MYPPLGGGWGGFMPFDFRELFLAGGLPLVLVAAFILFLWQTHKDFVTQLEKHSVERRETYVLFTAEREKSQTLFIEALSNHCATVQRALETQERALSDLVNQIKIMGEQIKS